MTPLFAKLNLGCHRDVVVLDAPPSFGPEVAALTGVTVRRAVGGGPVGFALGFVRTAAVDAVAGQPGVTDCVTPTGTKKHENQNHLARRPSLT